MSASKLSLKPGFCQMLLSLSLGMILVGCSIPTPQDRENTQPESASFFVDKSDVSLIEQNQHAQISMALSKNFSFRLCLKDQALAKPIINHRFEISGGDKTYETTSDAAGCLKWSETLAYNHLAPAKWIECIRQVKATGLHQGARSVNFALNPWEDQGLSLMDKKISQLVGGEQAVLALKAESGKGLWLDDVRLTISEKTPGALLGIELRAQASFSLVKTDGKVVQEPITRGNFKIEFTLMNILMKDKAEVRTLLGKTEAVPAQVVGGYLILPQEVQMSLQNLCSYGQVLMGIRLQSTVEDLPLQAFEAVYANIGECDQLKGSFFARLKTPLSTQTEGAKSIAEFLGIKDGKAELLGLEGPGHKKDSSTPMTVAKVVVKDPLTFTNIGYSGNNSYQREKTFSVTACFQGPIDSKGLRAQSFTIRKVNGETETRTSLNSGCITWDDSIRFHYLEKECWFHKDFQIRNDLLQMNETLSVEINPWDEGAASVRDSRKGRQHLACVDSQPQIVLNSYDFDTLETDYPIDDFLGIKVRRSGILKLTGRISRPTLKSAVGTEEALLPPGRYKLRWAIVDKSVKDFAKASGFIYQASEIQVRLQAAGTFAEPLFFESANIKAIGELNHILFEIEPLESHSNLVQETYLGSVVLSDRKEPGNLTPIGTYKESLIRKLMVQLDTDEKNQKQLREKLSQKSHLAETGNLNYLNLNEAEGTGKLLKALDIQIPKNKVSPFIFSQTASPSHQDLANWLESGSFPESLGSRFCHFWFQSFLPKSVFTKNDLNRMTHQCYVKIRTEPQSFFEIENRALVQKISKLEDLPAEIEDKIVGNAFYLSYFEDHSKTLSWDVNGGFNTGKSWMSPFSLGGGFRYQAAWVRRQSSGNTVTIQSNTTLQMEKLNFKLKADAYEKCAVIRLRPQAFPDWLAIEVSHRKDSKAVMKAITRGLMLCQGEIQKHPLIFHESYTVINQKVYMAQVLNPNSPMSRSLFMVVRGEKDHQNLMKLIAGQLQLPTSSDFEGQSKLLVPKTLAPAFQEMPAMPGHFNSP